MLDHHIQRQIVYELAFHESLRFGELKPIGMENKSFDYHLKKVVAAGYVQRNENGTYSLTAEGKRVGKGALKKPNRLIDRAYSTLLLAARRPEDGAWLLVKRKAQPLLGLKGFMNVSPVANEPISITSSESFRNQTGLTGAFYPTGHGYFRIYRDNVLESFIHFTLMTCNDIQGELIQNSELAEYYWDTDPDWQAPDMLPNMQTLFEMSVGSTGNFVEKTFYI